MAAMLDDEWQRRDLPVLIAIARELERTGTARRESITMATGFAGPELAAALRALEEGGFIRVNWGNRYAGIGVVVRMSAEARREVGLWPSAESLADKLLAELDQRITTAPTPDERTKWERIRDGLLSGGRDVVVDLTSAITARMIMG